MRQPFLCFEPNRQAPSALSPRARASFLQFCSRRQEAATTIDVTEFAGDALVLDALEPGLWEMSLLSCTRKHRSLLWYKYHRSMVRRHALARKKTGGSPPRRASSSSSASSTSGMNVNMTATAAKSDAISGVEMVPLSTLAMTVPMPPLTTVPTMSAASMSTLATKDVVANMEAQSNAAAAAANATAVAAVQNEADATTTSMQKAASQSSQSTPSPPPSSSWRAMFVTLFAMITPEWVGEHEAENDFLDDLRVKSVPPHISDVFNGKDNDLFWRYDMDSYAANRHNEDRSQYIEDVLENDATGTETSVFFCACYDGHGGEQAVDFVQANLYNNIKARLQTGTESIALCIINGFKDTDEEFHRRSQSKFKKGEWTACSVGACAVIALMVGKKLYVAGCGDCRAIMAFRDPTGALCVEQITSDHSANEEHEQRRLRVLHPDDYDIVREIGARNYYVKGRLQPTRSIGDTYMKVKDVNKAPMPRGLRIHGSFKRPYITAVPDVFEVDLQNRRPEFLVLGSDGLYGEMSNQEIVDMVAKFRDEGEANVSMALRTAVLERVSQYFGFSASDLEDICPGERRNYHDDITIDVLHFAPPHSESKARAAAA